ncbi:MAG: T9SS type A sorting domain-containing protein [Bacteroidetes bacterium]|nr:T9SS type A sorting domain-containing protein [Bacteroidota bacterium]
MKRKLVLLLFILFVIAMARFAPEAISQTCDSMGVENGWAGWLWQNGGDTGSLPPVWYGAPAANPSTSPAGPGGNFYTITSGTGIDTNGNFPVVCPGFGNHSIKIGDDCGTASNCNKLSYAFTVTPQDTNFVFAYAFVMNNVQLPGDMPRVYFSIYDTNDDSLPCAYYNFWVGANLPGLYPVSGTGCALGSALYKPWTTIGVNLAPYIGQTLNIVISNQDCIYGGHFAYSYFDFTCGAIKPQYCSGEQITLCAPDDYFSSGNKYQWSTGDTSNCIAVNPQPNDTFSVYVMNTSGCNYYLFFAPVDTGNCLTGVNEIYNNSISISPNPTSGVFTIQMDNGQWLMANGNTYLPAGTASTINIYNLLGEKIFTSTINHQTSTIDLSASPSGIYFLQIKTNEGVANKKLIINK